MSSVLEVTDHILHPFKEEEDLLNPKIPKGVHSDVNKSMAELARDQGLNFEEHTVITEDGYHLQVHHMWKSAGGSPVFF